MHPFLELELNVTLQEWHTWDIDIYSAGRKNVTIVLRGLRKSHVAAASGRARTTLAKVRLHTMHRREGR